MEVYFGDNQFLGVNHLSSDRAGEYFDKFAKPEAIAEVLKVAYSYGVRDFMFTTHPKTLAAIELIYDECPFRLHLCLPYAHSINDLITERGLWGALKSFLSESGIISSVKALGLAVCGIYRPMLKIILTHEISPYTKFDVRSINLLNVATDFFLGIGRKDLLKDFYTVVKDDFDVVPGFFTMNYPMLASAVWEEMALDDAQLIFNFNKSGFRVNPNISNVVASIDKYNKHKNIAMSLFSSGTNVDEICDFLNKNPGIQGALFGSATPKNIQSSFEAFSKL